MAEAPKDLVSCSSVEVVSEGGTIAGSADLCLHPVEVCARVLSDVVKPPPSPSLAS